MNGAETGAENQSSSLPGHEKPSKKPPESTSYLPLEVEVSPPGNGARTQQPGFSVARIARRVPATDPIPDPLVQKSISPAVFRESYREMRFAVEQLRERAGIRTLGVVSVSDGDGKSVTAANLAFTLTEGGKRRVALVDACFHDPKVAALLGAEARVGLSDVLAGRIPVDQAMFAAERPGLYGLAAGNVTDQEIDPLDVAEAFGTLINRLATVFDHVIVDTPSLDRHVDAVAFASRLDGVLMVVRAGKTRASRVDDAIAKLGENRVLGLILNRVV